MKFIRIFLTVCTILLFPSTLFSAPGQEQVDNYIERYRPIAVALSEEYGIPVSIILGVAIVESSAGKGPAVKNLNNHFGIIGRNHLAARGKHKSRYKEYTSAEESFRDFCKMISHKRFYEKVRCKTDPKLWVAAMSKAHYSELPQVWQKKILTAIHLYELDSF